MSREQHGDQAWKLLLMPKFVWICRILDPVVINQATAFMDILVPKRKGLLRKSAAASVEALVYNHRVLKRRRGAFGEL